MEPNEKIEIMVGQMRKLIDDSRMSIESLKRQIVDRDKLIADLFADRKKMQADLDALRKNK